MNAPPMAPITPEVIHMLNLSLPPQQQQNPMQHQNNFNLNPAMMQQMQQMMGMQGVDMGMMAQMMGNMGGGQGMGMQGQAGQQGQPGQGPGQGMIGQQGQMRQSELCSNLVHPQLLSRIRLSVCMAYRYRSTPKAFSYSRTWSECA